MQLPPSHGQWWSRLGRGQVGGCSGRGRTHFEDAAVTCRAVVCTLGSRVGALPAPAPGRGVVGLVAIVTLEQSRSHVVGGRRDWTRVPRETDDKGRECHKGEGVHGKQVGGEAERGVEGVEVMGGEHDEKGGVRQENEEDCDWTG